MFTYTYTCKRKKEERRERETEEGGREKERDKERKGRRKEVTRGHRTLKKENQHDLGNRREPWSASVARNRGFRTTEGNFPHAPCSHSGSVPLLMGEQLPS